jgi:hypothetical protein
VSVTVAAALTVAGLSACIAPDVEVIGALGVTVDEDGRAVLVVEACDGAATGVDMFFDREGLADDEVNEDIASWAPTAPVRGTSRLVLHAPAEPWQGEAVELPLERGYIASGAGEGDAEVLSQVAFRGADLAELDPAMVYSNDPDPDAVGLVERTPEDFTTQMCSRPGMVGR